MTIILPILEKDNQPPPPNPLNVLNLLLSKLKAMETSETTEEITEVDVELCNKIYYILNPAAAPAPEPIATEELSSEIEVIPTEGSPITSMEEAPSTEGNEAALAEETLIQALNNSSDISQIEVPVEVPAESLTEISLVDSITGPASIEAAT